MKSKITREQLIRLHACTPQVRLFDELFGEWAGITESNIRAAHENGLDVDFAFRLGLLTENKKDILFLLRLCFARMDTVQSRMTQATMDLLDLAKECARQIEESKTICLYTVNKCLHTLRSAHSFLLGNEQTENFDIEKNKQMYDIAKMCGRRTNKEKKGKGK